MKQFNAKAMILFFTLSMALFTADIEAKNNALDTSDTFHIYLVRHAEKDTEGYPNSKNPPLTKCGNTRAERLASMLANTAIQTIYSTEYLRTQRNSSSYGDKQNLPITSYNPRELTAFATRSSRNRNRTGGRA
ncbi:histidine phosphatase family protein [Psychrosphaera haliotis]|uniref:Histidine phosphatase family protein n=1 Tax=Psychrosphaera haliotis TaxID=555083 RepID=A0A6N8FA11_9GAMM|nr:histidine phosphatase family protein [Psychrosphaera haliotis]MUH73346.1 hypothetical protein [Psychrosphaera haliotis]